jgi:hypothetical protein
MTEIKTLVYFDIEATGSKSSGRPRISGISFVALDTQEIFDLNQKLLEKLRNVKSYEDSLELATIMLEVSKITGLDNYNLTGQARFEYLSVLGCSQWKHVNSYVGIKEIYKSSSLETGEFDKEMDADEKKSNEVSKNTENYQSRNLNNIKMCGDRNTVEKEF